MILRPFKARALQLNPSIAGQFGERLLKALIAPQALQRVDHHDIYNCDWAFGLGAEMGVSQVNWRSWLSAFGDLEVGSQLVDINWDEGWDTELWQWMNDLYPKSQRKALFRKRIGGNSGKRSWFLCWLYMLVAVPQFMDILKERNEDSDGSQLLWKIMQSLKLAIIQQRAGCLSAITAFCEALLQGHYYHRSNPGSLLSSFSLLRNMAPSVFGELQVECEAFSNCPVHGKCKEMDFQYDLLLFKRLLQWDAYVTDTLTSIGEYTTFCDKQSNGEDICWQSIGDRTYSVTT